MRGYPIISRQQVFLSKATMEKIRCVPAFCKGNKKHNTHDTIYRFDFFQTPPP